MPQISDPGKGQRLPAIPYRNAGRMFTLFLAAILGVYLLSGRYDSLFPNRKGVTREFETMNTFARIFVPPGSGTQGTAAAAAEQAENAVRRIHDLMSPGGPFSDVRRLNEAAAGQWIEVDPLTWTVIMEALRWHRLSEGAFDPTIGPIKRLFTFDQSEAADWPDAAALREAQSRVGADNLLFDREGMRVAWKKEGMRLDLGAIAKGFAADQAAQTLLRHGIDNALIDIGGELQLLGHNPSSPPSPWKAGIKNPRGDLPLETLRLSNTAVATSGDYERYFTFQGRRFEHIIDPRRGLPMSDGTASVTVIHPRSCLAADALATTLSVMGPEQGRAFLESQALGLFSSGVRVVMLSFDADNQLRRREMTVDAAGMVTVADGPAEP